MANDNGEDLDKVIPLSELRPGQTAEVARIDVTNRERLLKLSALGLVPGSSVRLQQRLPAYIIWVGETQLSLDQEVARVILLVRK